MEILSHPNTVDYFYPSMAIVVTSLLCLVLLTSED